MSDRSPAKLSSFRPMKNRTIAEIRSLLRTDARDAGIVVHTVSMMTGFHPDMAAIAQLPAVNAAKRPTRNNFPMRFANSPVLFQSCWLSKLDENRRPA